MTGPSRSTQLAALSERWRAVPNVGVRGRYEFLSQTVHLNSVMTRHLNASQAPDATPAERAFVLTVSAHEGTHWLDHLSTAWGRENLVVTFDAINALLLQKETELWRIRRLRTASAGTHLPAYYSTCAKDDILWDGRPWAASFSYGRRFGFDGRPSDDPVLFTRFQTQAGDQMARAPFSVAALLESRAVAAELQFEIATLFMLPANEREGELSKLVRRYAERLYHPRLCVYSVCAHAIANYAALSDIVQAYRRACALASLCLDLPEVLFPLLPTPPQLASHDIAVSSFKKGLDRGFAFLGLASVAPKDDGIDVESWLAETMAAGGLPHLEEVNRLIEAEDAKRVASHFEGRETARLQKLLAIGKRLRERRGVAKTYVDAVAEGEGFSDCAPMMLGDDRWVNFGKPPPEFADDSQGSWLDRVFNYERSMGEFLDACL
jgi:hypothetical protein